MTKSEESTSEGKKRYLGDKAPSGDQQGINAEVQKGKGHNLGEGAVFFPGER